MDDTSFRSQLKTGVIYIAISKYASVAITLVVTAILSRILTPKDFGVIAVASVFIVFLSIFSDMGLSSAIVQKRELTKYDLKDLFSFSLYLGVFLSLVFFLSSWLIARFYVDSQLIPVCQLLSLNILFVTWNIVPNGLLYREKLFKFIGIRTIIVQLSLAIVSIIGAICGLGVYSLLINPIGSSLLLFIISYAKYPLGFNSHPSLSSVRKIASYSIYTFGFSLINYFSRNLDKLVIGRVFGMIPLGFYEKSYRLMILPVQNLTSVITPVLHPVLADYQDDIKNQAYKYLKLTTILSIIGFPISVFLFFSAKELILLIFGDQWVPSIQVFKILSLTVGIQVSGSSIGAFYQAANKTKPLFILGLLNTVINVLGLMVGIFYFKCIEGVAWMWVLTSVISFWNNIYFSYIVKIKVLESFKPYFSALLPTACCIAGLSAFNHLLHIGMFPSVLIKMMFTALIIFFSLLSNRIISIHDFTRKRLN